MRGVLAFLIGLALMTSLIAIGFISTRERCTSGDIPSLFTGCAK